jgi:hypothetical protein
MGDDARPAQKCGLLHLQAPAHAHILPPKIPKEELAAGKEDPLCLLGQRAATGQEEMAGHMISEDGRKALPLKWKPLRLA